MGEREGKGRRRNEKGGKFRGGEKGTGREMKGSEGKREGKRSYQYFFSKFKP